MGKTKRRDRSVSPEWVERTVTQDSSPVHRHRKSRSSNRSTRRDRHRSPSPKRRYRRSENRRESSFDSEVEGLRENYRSRSRHHQDSYRSVSRSRSRSKERLSNDQEKMYGPALPPEMKLAKNKKADNSSMSFEGLEEDREGDREREKKRFTAIFSVLKELAGKTDISEEATALMASLEEHSKSKSYKDRAQEALHNVGLEMPAYREKYKSKPSMSNPVQKEEKKTPVFPTTDMVSSRVNGVWRSMCGLKYEEEWDCDASVPPPNIVKAGKSIPKSFNVSDKSYSIEKNEYWSDKGLNIDGNTDVKTLDQLDVAWTRSSDWEKITGSCLSTVNMMEVFTAHINSKFNKMLGTLKSYEDLPEEIEECLQECSKVKADFESQAKALQYITDMMARLHGDMVLARRDTVIKKTPVKLSQNSKDVLRIQPFGGQYLMSGKVAQCLKHDSEEASAKLVCSMMEKKNTTASASQSYRAGRPSYSQHLPTKNYSGETQKKGSSGYFKKRGNKESRTYENRTTKQDRNVSSNTGSSKFGKPSQYKYGKK